MFWLHVAAILLGYDWFGPWFTVPLLMLIYRKSHNGESRFRIGAE